MTKATAIRAERYCNYFIAGAPDCMAGRQGKAPACVAATFTQRTIVSDAQPD